jgi:hypothetical protein
MDLASIVRHMVRSGILASYLVKPIINITYIFTLNIIVITQILVFAISLSQIVKIENYTQYLVPGIVFLSFYTTVYMLIDDVFFFATRAEMCLYTYILPIPRYILAIGFSFAIGIIILLLYLPYVVFTLFIELLLRESLEILERISSLISLMILFSIVLGGLLASIFISVKSNWKLLLIIYLLSDIFQRFSTAYYPFMHLPEIYKLIALVNPITHFINLGQSIAGVNPALLIDPALSTAILISYLLTLCVVTVIGAQKFAEGGRIL